MVRGSTGLSGEAKVCGPEASFMGALLQARSTPVSDWGHPLPSPRADGTVAQDIRDHSGSCLERRPGAARRRGGGVDVVVQAPAGQVGTEHDAIRTGAAGS